ncbi:short C-terminal domain-containing protein [Thermodesulfovibrio aggregans]|uniref:Short C-terminal domain-containing protein n=1 Tax=Thermodesulfovibrio aggregans TaxID=86166 RepID=A0A0U9HNN1_9BACT|nr:SHOCT domain-containing protein [Thermodesulfovibrio aggregans]GAQ94702.1 short C-terminal domain-containing protein [Thermodesulfovibrio aggregans]
MKERPKIAPVRPSPFASKITIVMLIIFLFFGVAIMADAPDETPFAFFRIIWIIACLAGIVYSIKNLSTYSDSKKKNIPITATDVVEIDESEIPEGMDFEKKLRKLEALRKDGLITDEEYRQKRKEIMDEKW